MWQSAQVSFVHTRLFIRRISVQLTEKSYIQIKGKDSRKFLQGLCTNDIIKSLGSDYGSTIYSAFLSTKGRCFADVLLYNLRKAETEEDNLLLECDKAVAFDLMKHLQVYKLRSNVKICYMTDVRVSWLLYIS